MPLELLHILSEKTVQGLFLRDDDPTANTKRPHKLDDEGVQPIEPGFGLVLFDRLPYLFGDDLEVISVGVWGQRVNLGDGGILEKPCGDPPAFCEQ